MFGKFSEQVKKSAQPAASLFEMNVKTLELLSKQQTMFVTGVISDSVKLLSSLAEQTEVNGVVAAQSMYAESVRERLTSTSKATYSELNELRTSATDVVKNSLESANEQAKAAMVPVQTATAPLQKALVESALSEKKAPVAKKVAVAKKAPAAKKVAPVAKKAPTAKPTPTKVESAAEAKTAAPVVEKSAPVAKKPTAKKTAAKPSAKAVKAEKPAAAKTAAATPAAKPAVTSDKPAVKEVANLSPADVKAADKN